MLKYIQENNVLNNNNSSSPYLRDHVLNVVLSLPNVDEWIHFNIMIILMNQ